MKRKAAKTMAMSVVFAFILSGTALAGQWQQDAKGQWWQFEDGTYLRDRGATLDSNGDGMGEIYLFDAEGYLVTSTTTETGAFYNSDGQYVGEDGAVLSVSVATTYATTQEGTVGGYYLGDTGSSDWDHDGIKNVEYTVYYGYGVKVIDENTISVLADQFDNMEPITYHKVAENVYEAACPEGIDRITFVGSNLIFTCSAHGDEEIFKK